MLHIVRHGRTATNAAGKLQGRMNSELDTLGLQQATQLAQALGSVDRVVASPLLRTQQTAAAFGQKIETDERWIEMDYGEFDGQPLTAIDPEVWAAWRNDVNWAPPGGESLRQVGERVQAAAQDLLEASQTTEIVVVTHVSPIKASLAWALGVGDEVAWRSYVATASITSIGAGPSLRRFNDTSHLHLGI
ncbi:MAG TPA: histidine phosphatase family protein [Acidimicrobiia bacterium]|jgi:broad specificity phosphatase PhoE|nr:histidine phosphatase family protein [Acidimicrobiia bacterium]HIL47374.1 histidine phosphatase family protein [Acidimicrobiia bacterium]